MGCEIHRRRKAICTSLPHRALGPGRRGQFKSQKGSANAKRLTGERFGGGGEQVLYLLTRTPPPFSPPPLPSLPPQQSVGKLEGGERGPEGKERKGTLEL